eukprot:690817-Amphidinium_carterae.1
MQDAISRRQEETARLHSTTTRDATTTTWRSTTSHYRRNRRLCGRRLRVRDCTYKSIGKYEFEKEERDG